MAKHTIHAASAAKASPVAVVLRSESDGRTRALGELLGGLLEAGDVILLRGELGAGKTIFTQGVGVGLGVTEVINSPTFTLLKEYSGRLPLYHFDLYRIEDPEELFALGFDQYFGGDGVCVVEWSERGEAAAPWPMEWLRVTLRIRGPHERELVCEGAGARGQALLAALRDAAGAKDGPR